MDEYDLRNAHIKNEHVVWNNRQIYHFFYDCVFEDSRIDVDISARGWILTRTRFINCTIRLKRQLNNFSFCHSYLERCVLKGRFSGCDFGQQIEENPEKPLYYPDAGIVDCDLSAATLYACRFINCDLSTLRLPLWPHFTVCNPEGLREQALQLPWPGRTRIIPESWQDEPLKTVAITDDVRQVCKRFGATEEELKAVLAQLPGVIM